MTKMLFFELSLRRCLIRNGCLREFGERSLGCQGHQSVPLILSLGTLRPPESGSPGTARTQRPG